jgi:hypothetical protein
MPHGLNHATPGIPPYEIALNDMPMLSGLIDVRHYATVQ